MNFAFSKNPPLNRNWRPPRSSWRRFLGSRGERAAARHLKRRRFRILARNYRCPAGEIDLIASQGDTIVFVEVKTRSGEEDECPADLSARIQWPQIARAARYFLMQRSSHDRPCRFDLVTVTWPSRGKPTIEHFEDAYQLRGL